MDSIPRLAFPLRLHGASFATVEQDSIEDVTQQVQVVADTQPGTYLHQPELGVADLMFTELPLDTTGLEQAIGEFVENAVVTVDDVVDDREIAQGRDRVRVRVALAEEA